MAVLLFSSLLMVSAAQNNEYAGAEKCKLCHQKQYDDWLAWKFEGDVRSHLFAINTDPEAKMFTADGKYAQGYLTVEYACLNCHVGQSKEWALKYAKDIHEFKSSE